MAYLQGCPESAEVAGMQNHLRLQLRKGFRSSLFGLHRGRGASGARHVHSFSLCARPNLRYLKMQISWCNCKDVFFSREDSAAQWWAQAGFMPLHVGLYAWRRRAERGLAPHHASGTGSRWGAEDFEIFRKQKPKHQPNRPVLVLPRLRL